MAINFSQLKQDSSKIDCCTFAQLLQKPKLTKQEINKFSFIRKTINFTKFETDKIKQTQLRNLS